MGLQLQGASNRKPCSLSGTFICTAIGSLSEKAMAPHSSTFAQKIPWTEEPGRLQSMGSLESDTTKRLHFHFSFSCIGEGNGNPLQCSCLENPRDGEAWQAAISGVAQSRTRLKRHSSSSSSLFRQWLFSCDFGVFIKGYELKYFYFTILYFSPPRPSNICHYLPVQLHQPLLPPSTLYKTKLYCFKSCENVLFSGSAT